MGLACGFAIIPAAIVRIRWLPSVVGQAGRSPV
jgi:hypothetical protein